MTYITLPTLKNISTVLATGAMLTFSTVTASYAEKSSEDEIVAVIDDAAGLYTDCAKKEGSTFTDGLNKFSCTTEGGQRTTCNKTGDPDTACGTIIVESSIRDLNNLFMQFGTLNTAPATMSEAQSTGTYIVPSQVFMQYSTQN